MSKNVLITGTSGGIGKALALELLGKRYTVFGCNRRQSNIDHPSFHPIIMDVTSEESVKKGLEEVSKAVSSLGAVVNVSGVMFMGSLIEEGEGRLNQIMQVNLMGMERVNRLFFPLVEKEKGRFINFSSEYGTYQVVPFNAFYTISKHAVESYSDGLRRELKYIGIPVITIRPGAFKTEMENSTSAIFKAITDNSTHYKGVLKKMAPLLEGGTKNAKDPKVMARVVVKAIEAKKPKRVYKSNHNLGVKIMSYLPQKMVYTIFYLMFK